MQRLLVHVSENGVVHFHDRSQRALAETGHRAQGVLAIGRGDAKLVRPVLALLRKPELEAQPASSGKALADLVGDLKVFPQTIKNVRVRQKIPFAQIPAAQAAIAAAERELDGNGRVVVRYSGTEALARVMIEAESKEPMNRLADAIVAAIRSELGA